MLGETSGGQALARADGYDDLDDAHAACDGGDNCGRRGRASRVRGGEFRGHFGRRRQREHVRILRTGGASRLYQHDRREERELRLDQKISVGQRTVRVDADGKIDFASPKMKLTLKGQGSRSLQLRRVGKYVYMQYPSQAPGQLPSGTSWVAIDQTKLGKKRFGVSYAQLQQGLTTNPMQPLRYLRGVSDVTKAGTATVGGVTTTHYKVKVDLRKLSRRLDGDARRGVRTMIERLGGATLPLQLWLDERGRVRKEKLDLRLTTRGGRKAVVDMTVRFSDFGTPVRVSAPPGNRTAGLEQVLGNRG